MIQVLYIGKNKDNVFRFRKYWKEIIAVDNTEHLQNIINQKIDVHIIMFENVESVFNFQEISLLKKRFPKTYIILVTENNITKDDSLKYLTVGVVMIISPFASEEVMKRNIEYLRKKDNFDYSDNKKKHLVKPFKMPLGKRLFDIVFSSLVLLVLSPFFIVIAILIRIESKGPIIYKSKRVGSNYKIFDFLKFRSMYPDADKRLKEFLSLNQYGQNAKIQTDSQKHNENIGASNINIEDSSAWFTDDSVISEDEYMKMRHSNQENAFVKYKNDPRITKVGRFIRKYSIDELPQIINILKGDMSVVGNRPLPLYEAELLTTDKYIDRFIAPAGLTGLWQVEKRGGSAVMSAEERKELDIYYAKHCSFWFDMKIIFRTFFSFIQKEDV